MQPGGGNGDLAGRYGRALWVRVLKKKLHEERTPEICIRVPLSLQPNIKQSIHKT